MLYLCICGAIVLWTFLEASLWWVAPDISISIAYIYFPLYWKRFLFLALLGAFIGSLVTYTWAYLASDYWFHYVSAMRFHTQANIQHVQQSLTCDSPAIIKAAWTGIPYKLFFGLAAMKGLSFAKIAPMGLLSRAIRFVFVLMVTCLIRHYTKPWGERHRLELSLLLLLIWFAMITLFDVYINKAVG